MDHNSVQYKRVRVTTRSQDLHIMPFLRWIFLLSIIAGCSAAKPTITEPVTVSPQDIELQPITHLDNGRNGFVISEHPGPSAPWQTDFDRSVLLMQSGRESDAIPILEKIVGQSPNVTAPYINLAIAYRHARQFEQAEEQLKTALELMPVHPVVNNEYGLLLRQSGRFEEAREIYQNTLVSFPEYSPARRNLGILCELYLRDTACAYEQYSIYLESNPDDESVALWIADLNLRMGRN
jgi:tetratricopeptide (TPR) repeat protein